MGAPVKLARSETLPVLGMPLFEPTKSGVPDCRVRMPLICHGPIMASTTLLPVWNLSPFPKGNSYVQLADKIWVRSKPATLLSIFRLYGSWIDVPSTPNQPSEP